MRAPIVIAMLGACASNVTLDEVPLQPTRTLIVAGHMDDDVILMQPATVDAATAGSVTTVYMTSRTPYGRADSHKRYHAIRTAYGEVAGDQDWACGKAELNGLRAYTCRLDGPNIAQVSLNVPDGGRRNDNLHGLVYMIEGHSDGVTLVGDRRATRDDLVGELAEIITQVQPEEIHLLDYSAQNEDDHPDHMMVAAFALWGIAQAGYHGPIVSHMGYSGEGVPVSLTGDDYQRSHQMIGYYEACNDGCGPCGEACATIDESHDIWVQRQRSTTITFAPGKLSPVDQPGRCLAVVAGRIALADCASADAVRLDERGQLVAGAACIASAPDNDGPLALVPCDMTAATRWFLDGNDELWNGRPVEPTGGDMSYNHTRCLIAEPLGAPVCGVAKRARWQRVP